MSGRGIDAATGEPTELPVAQIGDAVRSGAILPTADTELPMVVGDGSIQLVRAADLEAARDQGWEIASAQQVQAFRDAQKYESAGAQARTAGEAAVRGLTLGLSDGALVELGVDPEGLRKRKELNPIIAGGSEIAGAVAPLLLTGGGSGVAGAAATGVRAAGIVPRGVAAAGRAVEAGVQAGLGTGIAARGAALGAAGAVEGGLYGLGQAVSEAALQDAPLTGERIAAHMGTGALLGGVTGGVLGSTAASVEQRLIPKVKEILSSPQLERAVETAGLKQWAQGRGKAMFTKLRRDFGDDAPITIGRAVREEGLDEVMAKGATWDEMHAIVQDKHRASGARIGEALKQIDKALPGEAAPAVRRIVERADSELIASLNNTGIKSDRGLAKKVREDFPGIFGDDTARAAPYREPNRSVASAADDAVSAPSVTPQRRTVATAPGDAVEAYDSFGMPVSRSITEHADEALQPGANAVGTGPVTSRGGVALDPMTLTPVTKQGLDPALFPGAGAAGGRAAPQTTAGAFVDIDPLTLSPVTREAMSFEQLHKLRARIDDIAFPKGLADPSPYQKSLQKLRGIIEEEITTAADAAATKMASAGYASNYSAEKLRYRALGWLNKAAESNAASELANRTVSLSDYVSGSAVTAGSLASLLAGDMSALGAVAMSAFMGTGASLVNKFMREQGQGIAARMGEKVIRLARTAQKQEAEVSSAVTRFFSKASDTTRAGALTAGADAGPLLERFERARAKLEEYERAPEHKLSRVMGDTDDAAPVIAQEVRAVAQRGASFLRSKLPMERISEYDAQPLLKRDGARVSDSAMAKYLRYERAVENPRSVIADLADGKVTNEGIEALKNVYPLLYADLTQKLTSKLSQQTERLPRAQLMQLSIATGQPLHPSMSPTFIAACQNMHKATRELMQKQASAGSQMGGGGNAAASMQTDSQRMEARA